MEASSASLFISGEQNEGSAKHCPDARELRCFPSEEDNGNDAGNALPATSSEEILELQRDGIVSRIPHTLRKKEVMHAAVRLPRLKRQLSGAYLPRRKLQCWEKLA